MDVRTIFLTTKIQYAYTIFTKMNDIGRYFYATTLSNVNFLEIVLSLAKILSTKNKSVSKRRDKI